MTSPPKTSPQKASPKTFPKGPTRQPSRLSNLSFRTKEALLYPVEDWWRRRWGRSHLADPINQKELQVIGMRRTGNHAVLNWIQQQQPGEVTLLNNVAAGRNPYRYKADNLRRYHPEHEKMAAVYEAQAKGALRQRDCLIYSYEDWSLQQITAPRFERNRALYLGKSEKPFDVLLLRDPFNLFASRLKQKFTQTKAPNLSMVALWVEYAKEFVGESQYLKRNRICVNYNRWFADEDYRRELADRLDIPFTDAGIDKVTSFGGGSSFDGTGLSGKARAMDVTSRWQTFADDPVYRQLFENEAVWDYSAQIFGELPGTACLRPR
ncbi:MAG: hypothetical protein AAFS06_07335 [Cyanobacteria bacterium J06631_12]